MGVLFHFSSHYDISNLRKSNIAFFVVNDSHPFIWVEYKKRPPCSSSGPAEQMTNSAFANLKVERKVFVCDNGYTSNNPQKIIS